MLKQKKMNWAMTFLLFITGFKSLAFLQEIEGVEDCLQQFLDCRTNCVNFHNEDFPLGSIMRTDYLQYPKVAQPYSKFSSYLQKPQ